MRDEQIDHVVDVLPVERVVQVILGVEIGQRGRAELLLARERSARHLVHNEERDQ